MGFFLKGLFKLFEIIYEEAEHEYYDEDRYIELLHQLFRSLENGEITEEEYEKEEELILERLREIRNYKRGIIGECDESE